MHTRSFNARQPAGTAARLLWLVRWLLVLVLVWDQVSSPLHHHGHDFGADAQWITASTHDGQAAAPHLEADDHDARVSRAVLAVRPKLDLGSLTLSDDPGHGFAPGQAFGLAEPGVEGPEAVDNDASARPRSTHRSLPPAGRAPPLHI